MLAQSPICQEHEARRAAQETLAARVKRLRSDPSIYRPFLLIPEAQEWLTAVRKDALRYPILVVIGPSRTGKTEWANSLFRHPLDLKNGSLTFFPDSNYATIRYRHDRWVTSG